jgi:hypothetical protein
MKKKFIAITICFLFFVSLFNSGFIAVNIKENDNVNEKATVYLNNFNVKNLKSTSSIELSYNQAEQIKNRFLEIEKNYQGIEKINKQIQILKEIDILPSDFSVDVLLSTLDNYNISSLSKSSIPFLKLTMGGPLIVSHLTLGGRINCLFSLNALCYNSTNLTFNDILNGSYINRIYGILPIYIGTAFRPVFVTVYGPKIVKNSKNCLFPFFEILVPCTGFSIAFYYVTKNSRPIVLFEYNLDACLAGFIAGF